MIDLCASCRSLPADCDGLCNRCDGSRLANQDLAVARLASLSPAPSPTPKGEGRSVGRQEGAGGPTALVHEVAARLVMIGHEEVEHVIDAIHSCGYQIIGGSCGAATLSGPISGSEGTDTGPLEEFWDSEPAHEEARRIKLVLIARQVAEVRPALNLTVTCPCGFQPPLILAHLCFFCGVYFCKRCSARHFAAPHNGQSSSPSPIVNTVGGETLGDTGEGAECYERTLWQNVLEDLEAWTSKRSLHPDAQVILRVLRRRVDEERGETHS